MTEEIDPATEVWALPRDATEENYREVGYRLLRGEDGVWRREEEQ